MLLPSPVKAKLSGRDPGLAWMVFL